MKRYLVIDHFGETYTTDDLTKTHLVGLKEKTITAIFDISNSTFFDAPNNKWIPINIK